MGREQGSGMGEIWGRCGGDVGEMWGRSHPNQAHARLNELAEFFSGERALTRVGKDEQRVGLA